MGAHDQNRRLTCPICLKAFDTPQAVKTHQKHKGHSTHHEVPEPWAKYAPHHQKGPQ
jgi:hypothetical protein